MDDTDLAPLTTTAATRANEPEVKAAISSAEGNRSSPTAFRSDEPRFGYGAALLLFAGACAIGYGARLLMQRRG